MPKYRARLFLLAGFGVFFAMLPNETAGAGPEPIYDEQRVPEFTLPDPLVSFHGAHVANAQQWRSIRRPEIMQAFAETVYGRTVGGPLPGMHWQLVEEDSAALDGAATRRQVAIFFSKNENGPRMDLLLYTPNNVTNPAPAFLGLNFGGNQTVHPDSKILISPNWMRPGDGVTNGRATDATRGAARNRWQIERLIRRGYAIATAYYGDLDPDTYESDFSDGIHPLFYNQPGQTKPAPNEWGAIGAWAWGLSRALDYLEADEKVDGKRVAVFGHSRLGKTALWAGAQDERFALVISNDSGCGGAALYRRAFGERIHHMVDNRIAYWFCENHAQFAERESELPVDQHLLIAAIAPRPVYIASAAEDRWADPRGEFLAALHASPVYELLGAEGLPVDTMPKINEPVAGTIGYHIRSGKHNITEFDWNAFLDFADRHL